MVDRLNLGSSGEYKARKTVIKVVQGDHYWVSLVNYLQDFLSGMYVFISFLFETEAFLALSRVGRKGRVNTYFCLVY